MRGSGILALTLLLAGCMVGPDYVKPPVDAPNAFIYEAKDAADTANTQWWHQFNDPVLDQLIAEALANNLNVKVAAANVEQAAGVLTQTRSSLFPQLGYNGSAGRGRVSESTATPQLSAGIPNPQSSYEALLSASWEIDLWGRIRRLSEGARANLLATDEARRGVILSLVVLRGEQLPHAARARRAARGVQAHARRLRRVGAAVHSCSSSTARCRRCRSRRCSRNTRPLPCRSR